MKQMLYKQITDELAKPIISDERAKSQYSWNSMCDHLRPPVSDYLPKTQNFFQSKSCGQNLSLTTSCKRPDDETF